MNSFTRSIVSLGVLLFVGLVGCKTAPTSESGRQDLTEASRQALAEMKNADPSLQGFMDTAHGYALFPSVGRGGFIVGGGWGRGVVFQQGKRIGFADITQANIGLTAGGQTQRQIIVFQNQQSLDRFKANQLAMDANASAVALTSGAAASAKYNNGVAVFVQPIGGLMAELNVGGQQFRYQPDVP